MFAPGESIPIDFQLTNVGLVPIKKVQVFLRKSGFAPFHNSVIPWSSDLEGGVEILLHSNQRSEIHHFNNCEVIIPSTEQASRSEFQHLPEISYNIIFRIHTGGFNTSATVEAGICLVETPIDISKHPPSYEELEENDLPSYENVVLD